MTPVTTACPEKLESESVLKKRKRKKKRLWVSFSLSFFAFFSLLSFVFFSFLCFFFPFDLRLSCVCVVISTTCNIYEVVFLGWQEIVFSRREYRDVDISMDLAHRRLTTDFTFLCLWWH